MLPPATIAYYAIQSVNIFLLTLLTGTFLISSRINRHATIPNNLILWILQSIFANLLLFAGYSQSANVPTLLCKIQSALQYGAPPALSAAAITVVSRVWFLTWSVDKNRNMNFQDAVWVTPSIIAFPYVVWGVTAAICAIISGNDVRPVLEYCASDNQTPSIISGVVAAALLVVACIFQFWALAITYGRYRVSRRLGPMETGGADTALFIRIAAFSIFIVVALILALVATVSAWSQVAPDIIVACIGLVVFFIFASQRDVLEAWGLRKHQLTSFSASGNGVRSFASGRTRAMSASHRRNISIGSPNLVTTMKARNQADDSTDTLDRKPDPRALNDEEMQVLPPSRKRVESEVVEVEEYDHSSPPSPAQVVVELAPNPSEAPSYPPRPAVTSSSAAGFPVIAYGPPSPSPHSWRVSTQGRMEGFKPE